MIDDYSFSTSWNCSQHEKGEEIVADITALGFRTIELNFQLNADKLRGILESVETGVVAVSSVHNYCPFPAETPLERVNPDDPSLASNEERVRKRAVEYTKRSIETAANLGARVLIIHSGKVAIASRTRKLIRLYQTKGESSKEFQMLRAAAIDERAHSVKEHFDALSTSYAELIPYAREKRVKLGVENRFYHYELPLPEELQKLLKYFDDTILGYWHDIGHAYVLERLGFYKSGTYLASFHKRMIGIHIHDIINFYDHHPPLAGEFDWRLLRRYNFERVIKVLEVHAHGRRDDILTSIKRLDKEVFSK